MGSLDHPDEQYRDNHIVGQTIPIASGVYQLKVSRGLRPGVRLSGILSLDDLDDDGEADFMFASHTQNADRQSESIIHVVYSSSLSTLDRSDRNEDRIIRLHNNLDDTDGDGIANLHDLNDDNDGAFDLDDIYPLDARAIYDADGDGTANVIDVFPDNPFEDSDMDGDGIGDRSDPDTDGDGIENFMDQFPLDTDNDGLNNYVDSDDDNDGVDDRLDAFPINPAEQFDTDGDGVGDNSDLFVIDETEWEDFDLDGIGNNADVDDDNDGYVDTRDIFPFDPDEWFDTDGDGIGDNTDLFPNNPFEWEDKDNDGLGDNLSSTGIAIHRVESEWAEVFRSSSQVELNTYYLGVFDLTGGPEILIEGGNPLSARGALYVLSSNDLRQLDTYDQKVNQTINIDEIPQGIHSWELRGPRNSFGLFYWSGGAVSDVDQDEIGDLIIGGPKDDFDRGSVYIVRGAQLANADAIDGTMDGKINHTQCSIAGMCIVIQNAVVSGLGADTTSLKGLYGDGRSTIVVSNTYSTELKEGDAENIPMVYLLSDSAILQEMNEKQDAVLQLQQILERDNTLQIFTEFPEEERSSIRPNIHQLSDYDGDGVEDLLLKLNSSNTHYFMASSDIVSSDLDDGSKDGQVSISHIRNRPSSYRLDGFEIRTHSAHTTIGEQRDMFEASQFIPLTPTAQDQDVGTIDGSIGSIENKQQIMYLVDPSEFAKHDTSDGSTDGIVTNIETSDTNTWEIIGVPRIELCNGWFDDPATYVVADATLSERLSFSLFTLGAMRSYVRSTGETNNTVNIPDAISEGAAGIWNINLGSLGNNLAKSQVTCVGDWDRDGREDVAISLLYFRFDPQPTTSRGPEVKTSVILLMTGDLPALDNLDGSLDNQVDLSLLWREPLDG